LWSICSYFFSILHYLYSCVRQVPIFISQLLLCAESERWGVGGGRVCCRRRRGRQEDRFVGGDPSAARVRVSSLQTKVHQGKISRHTASICKKYESFHAKRVLQNGAIRCSPPSVLAEASLITW
jgi:hypothetical protein